ncbi:MAG: IS21 family transposase, partial [Enterococcus aquimarinus]
GKLIQDKNHLRDRTKGISAMMESTIRKFEDQVLAQMFMLEIKKKYPRYIRDQLQLVNQQ